MTSWKVLTTNCPIIGWGHLIMHTKSEVDSLPTNTTLSNSWEQMFYNVKPLISSIHPSIISTSASNLVYGFCKRALDIYCIAAQWKKTKNSFLNIHFRSSQTCSFIGPHSLQNPVLGTTWKLALTWQGKAADVKPFQRPLPLCLSLSFLTWDGSPSHTNSYKVQMVFQDDKTNFPIGDAFQ